MKTVIACTLALLCVAACAAPTDEFDTGGSAISGSPNAAQPVAPQPQNTGLAEAYRCDQVTSHFAMLPTTDLPAPLAGSSFARTAAGLDDEYITRRGMLGDFNARLAWTWKPDAGRSYFVLAVQYSKGISLAADADRTAALVQVYDAKGALVLSGVGHSRDLQDNDELVINSIDWSDRIATLKQRRANPPLTTDPSRKLACSTR